MLNQHSPMSELQNVIFNMCAILQLIVDIGAVAGCKWQLGHDTWAIYWHSTAKVINKRSRSIPECQELSLGCI